MSDDSGVVSRSALRKGITFDDIGRVTWEDSWIENPVVRFNTDSPVCTECNKKITDTLLVTGERQVYPDAPLPVSGSDKVHFHCITEFKEKNPETYLKEQKLDVTKVPGFFALSREDKVKFLDSVEQKYSEADLVSDNLAFADYRFFFSGKFTNQPELEDIITTAGGKIVKQTEDVTHIVLGSSGRKFANVWGEGSSSHKAALKHEPEVVSGSWLSQKVTEAKDKADEFKKAKEEFLKTWREKKAQRDSKKAETAKKRADKKAAKRAREETVVPQRSSRKRKVSAKAAAALEDNDDDEDDDDDEDKPRKNRGRKKKVDSDEED